MTERTKLVVRHLPAGLPEEIFWKTLSPWIDPISNPDSEDKASLPPRCSLKFKYYVAGKVRKNKNKVDIPSRAYIQFATPDQVVEFHQGYARQAFRDSNGNITYPKVEFAPHQKTAGQPKKTDPRIGTIESDSDYIAFLKSLENPNPKPDLPVDSEKLNEDEDFKSTPLLEHLRNARKAAQEASIAAKKQQQQQRQASSSQFSKKSSKAIVQPQIMKRDLSLSSSNEQKPERDCSQANKKPSSNDQVIPSSKKVSNNSKSSPTKQSTSHQSNTNPKQQATSSKSQTDSNNQSAYKLKRQARGANDQGVFCTSNAEGPKPISSVASKANYHNKSSPALKKIQPASSSLKMVESTPSSRTSIDERIETKSYAAKGPSSSNSNSKSTRGCKDSRKKSMRTSEDGGKVQVQENNKKNTINSSKSVFNGKNEQSQSSAPHSNETSKRSGGNKLAGDAAAGARRSLGMALAGISGSKPERKKRSDVNDSKPAVLQE